MSIQIKDNCNMCLKCVNLCRTKSLTVQNGKVTYEGSKCNKCYHCYSICPAQAIQIEGQTNKLDNAFIQQLKQRRSIRRFKQEKIDEETLQQLQSIKQFAPSACNLRPVQVKIISLLDNPQFEQDIVKLADYKVEERLFRTAPYLYFAYVSNEALKTNYLPIEDAIITTYQAGLYLNSINLGGFWCGYLSMLMKKNQEICSYVKKALQIPEQYQILEVYGFGKPDIKYEREIDREEVKVTFL